MKLIWKTFLMIVYHNYLQKNIQKFLLIKKTTDNKPKSVPDDEPFTIDIKRLRFEEDDVNDNSSVRLRVLHLIL